MPSRAFDLQRGEPGCRPTRCRNPSRFIHPRNDSQVIFYDQVIPGSTLVGYLNADHWAIAIPVSEKHPFIGRHFVDRNEYPRQAMFEAVLRFIEEDLK